MLSSALSPLSYLQLKNLPDKIPKYIHVTVEWKTPFEYKNEIKNCEFIHVHDNTWIVKIDSRFLEKTLISIIELRDETPYISGLESL